MSTEEGKQLSIYDILLPGGGAEKRSNEVQSGSGGSSESLSAITDTIISFIQWVLVRGYDNSEAH
jgi:hypothetical protein